MVSKWKDASVSFRKQGSSMCHTEPEQEVIVLPKTTKDVGETLSTKHAEKKWQLWLPTKHSVLREDTFSLFFKDNPKTSWTKFFGKTWQTCPAKCFKNAYRVPPPYASEIPLSCSPPLLPLELMRHLRRHMAIPLFQSRPDNLAITKRTLYQLNHCAGHDTMLEFMKANWKTW